MNLWWWIKYQLTKCRCKGNPAKCDHTKHGMVTGGGTVTDLAGNVVYSHQDPSWMCSGCGLPLEPVGGWAARV